MQSRDRGKKRKRAVGAVVLLAAIAGGIATLRAGPAPRISIAPELPGIGPRTPIAVDFSEPVRGLERVKVDLVQGDRAMLLAERKHVPREFWRFWGPRVAEDRVMVEVGSETVDGLKSGEATLRATADRVSTWLRHPAPASAELALPVRLTPPYLAVLSNQHYLSRGGSEAVVYRVGETAVESGVQVGELTFPGYPLPGGGPSDRLALFGAPFDLEDSSQIRLVAVDDLGNRAERSFLDQFFAVAYKTDTIRVTDRFMEKVVPEIMSSTPGLEDQGSLLDNYLWINRELRRANARTLEELALESARERLWRGAFQPMPNAKVMSTFADRRTYLYDGAEVDRQDHQGFDLASVRRAAIPSANAGVVVLARYFGIYGNAVVVDHGLGLMSLYGHLSAIEVSAGQPVARGDIVGRSGETGLAGGDHLHFTILLHGLPVTPMEWWDGKWIGDRLERKIDAAVAVEP